MKPESIQRRPPWVSVVSSWLRQGARGAAVATTAASLSHHRSTIHLPGKGHSGVALLQQGGSSVSVFVPGPSRPATAPSESCGKSEQLSDTSRLHFCDKTNEPEDACNAQWLVVSQLWSYASYAPERPTEEEQELLRTFFEFFPDQCTKGPAANCYSEAVRTSPPRVRDRRELLLWLCTVENRCRLKAGVEPKRCRHSELLKRWRYTDGYV